MRKRVLFNVAAVVLVLVLVLVVFKVNKGIEVFATDGKTALVKTGNENEIKNEERQSVKKDSKGSKTDSIIETPIKSKVKKDSEKMNKENDSNKEEVKIEVKEESNEKTVEFKKNEEVSKSENNVAASETKKSEVVSEKQTNETKAKETTQVKQSAPVKKDTTTTKESSKTEVVGFETVRQNDSSMEKGKEVVSQEGSNGSKVITYKETYVNGNMTSKDVMNTTISVKPVNKVVKVGTKTTPQAAEVLNNSILSKNGNNYSYSDYGDVAVSVKTNGTKVTQVTFDGMGYYGYQYVTKQLLVNEYGEKEGSKKFNQNQQQMRNIESAIRSAANAVHGSGTAKANALYSELLNGGNSQNAYTKSF